MIVLDLIQLYITLRSYTLIRACYLNLISRLCHHLEKIAVFNNIFKGVVEIHFVYLLYSIWAMSVGLQPGSTSVAEKNQCVLIIRNYQRVFRKTNPLKRITGGCYNTFNLK